MSKGLNGGKVKYLRPPFKWVSLKMGLQEDRERPRLTNATIRAMRNGVYDWRSK